MGHGSHIRWVNTQWVTGQFQWPIACSASVLLHTCSGVVSLKNAKPTFLPPNLPTECQTFNNVTMTKLVAQHAEYSLRIAITIHIQAANHITYGKNNNWKILQGGHKVGEKIPRVFQTFPWAINLLFHRLSQKSKCNNDLYQGLLYINSSNITYHHLFLHKNNLFVTIFPEVAQNFLRIPRVFNVQRNPWVFQFFFLVFQGHPVLRCALFNERVKIIDVAYKFWLHHFTFLF